VPQIVCDSIETILTQITTNCTAYWVVHILFHFANLPVPRDIMIPSSFILAITHSILPIDIQHKIPTAVHTEMAGQGRGTF